jgi:hypothetical protein
MTLTKLVEDFKLQHGARRLAEALPFKTLPFAVAVRRAALCVRADGKRHSHQYRIPASVLIQCAANLDRVIPRLRTCKSFDSIYELVGQEIRHIHGVGELVVYDITERIGICLNLMPQVLYLHAGTREGAKKLGFTESKVDIKDLPEPLQSLSASELEDFFCNYKNLL